MADNLTEPWSDSRSFCVRVTQYVGASYGLRVLRFLWPVSASLPQKFMHFFHEAKRKKDFISQSLHGGKVFYTDPPQHVLLSLFINFTACQL